VKRRRIINLVSVAVIALAAVRLLLFFNPRPPAVDLRPHRTLGEILAAEAVGALAPDGRLIVVAREVAEFEVPAAEAQLMAFLRSVKKAGRSVAIERHVKVDPLRPLAVPSGDFFDLIRQAKENDVVVSFLGPPALSDEQVGKLGDKRPRILAVCPGAMPARIDLRKIFQQKLLVMAVVSRPEAPAVLSPGGGQAAFDQMFKVIHPDNLAELPSLATTAGSGTAR
jgi:hypothetical protein